MQFRIQYGTAVWYFMAGVLVLIACLAVAAFVQGREITFWPPRIGARGTAGRDRRDRHGGHGGHGGCCDHAPALPAAVRGGPEVAGRGYGEAAAGRSCPLPAPHHQPRCAHLPATHPAMTTAREITVIVHEVTPSGAPQRPTRISLDVVRLSVVLAPDSHRDPPLT